MLIIHDLNDKKIVTCDSCGKDDFDVIGKDEYNKITYKCKYCKKEFVEK